jgi:hypothetical protein
MPISGSLNYLNTYTADDETTPSQFMYEAANCHIFYTTETLYQHSTTWALAANVTWGSAQCVGGIQPRTDLGEYDEDDTSTTSSSSASHRPWVLDTFKNVDVSHGYNCYL